MASGDVQPPDDHPSRPTLRQRWEAVRAGIGAAWTWATGHRWQAGLVVGASLISLAGGVLGFVLIASQGPAGPPIPLEKTLAALDAGAYVEARELAKQMQKQGGLGVEELGGPVFVLGASWAYEADDTWSKDKTRYYLLASRYLEEARDRGFPPGRRAEGLYLLGRSLYLSGQIAASRPMLLEALKHNPRKRTEIHRLLSEAYLNAANPRLEEALRENEHYLADRRVVGPDRHRGLLRQAWILLRLERIPECLATLDQIPSDAKNRAEAMVIRGQLLMHEARKLKDRPEASAEDLLGMREKYRAAIKTLQLAQGRDTLGTQATRKAMYLIGVCFLEMGDYRAAMGQFARTRKLHADTPEGFAAGFQEAELCRHSGRDADALAGYRRTLNAVGDPENFSNPWITLDELRSRMLTAYQDYLQTGKFEIDLQLTRHFYPLFSRQRTLELMGDTYSGWGRALLAQAAQLSPAKAKATQRLGRAQLRQAGRVYARLAKLQVTTRKYPDQLWNSANAYLDGHDYGNAIRILREYLKNEARRRHPQALVRLGEARLALSRIDEALEDFRQCIEFHPRDAAAYRARLLASNAYLEKGDLQQAETLLAENLAGEHLTPESPEWRDSLFALGELLHIEGRYEEAVRRLEEAVAPERYPDAPQALQARYLIADSYRRMAKSAQEKLHGGAGSASRVIHPKEIAENFDKALHWYEQVRKILNHRQQSAELTPLEKAMLRNCYFAVGDLEFSQGHYEAAIKAYSTATNRYQDHPEVLVAYMQIANAYRRLNKDAEARSTLQQAKVVLGRMKPDADFTKATNYDRQQWSELLDSLSTL